MGDDQGGRDPLLEWGMAGWGRRVGLWLAVTSGLVAATYLILRTMFDSVVSDIWPIFIPQVLLTVLPVVLMRQRSGLRVDGNGIAVQGPAPMRGTWRWDELVEVAAGTNPEAGGAGVAVRPQGSTWDTPGPLAPVFAYLRRGQSLGHVQEVLARECERHGVAFTSHPDGFGTARPGSPLRRDC